MAIPVSLLNDSRLNAKDRDMTDRCVRLDYHDFFEDWDELSRAQQDRLLP